MKVIFLDIDGVLNTERRAKAAIDNEYLDSHDEFGRMFDEESLFWLNKIIDETDAQIVISSSWRNDGLGTLRKMWRKRYCKYIKGWKNSNPYKHYDRIFDTTFSLTTSKYAEQKNLMRQLSEDDRWHRGWQIDIYLRTHPEVENFVIIDDDTDILDFQKRYFINAKDPNGITKELANKAIEILKS